MNFSFKNLFFLLSLILANNTQASTISIEKYSHERDYEVAKKIFNENPDYLTYEAMGMPQGTTEKYLTHDKYITEVIRVDGQTVGFINYIAYNAELLTFHIMRSGLIHLVGIDAEHQGKGYGKQLMQHAIQQLHNLNTPNDYVKCKSAQYKST